MRWRRPASCPDCGGRVTVTCTCTGDVWDIRRHCHGDGRHDSRVIIFVWELNGVPPLQWALRDWNRDAAMLKGINAKSMRRNRS